MNIKMQVDDPPYLSVGTAVSAKYKGAFCEAKVSKVVRIVKCKVTYKMGLGTATVSDEQVKGTLRVGHTVQAKHSERKEFVEATIAKIQDCSQYTVVFDDGDITTLRRSALCLKSGRHFNESETLDQLPLTHPEHFGNPVVGGRRGRRNRQLKDDSSDGEAEEENEPDLEGYSNDIGRVVSVEATDKKRGKDNWFPGLVVIPSAQPTVRINVKDEYLVRSFKDGRYYTVPKKEVNEFSRNAGEKVESSVLAEAVHKALKYLDNNELPVHWERNSLFNMQSVDTDSEENYSDSSDDEPNEEKDRFVAQLYKFMDDSGTPLNKSPMVAEKDVDLHKLFRVVQKLGGYNRATNQNKWRYVTSRLKLPTNQTTFNQVKAVYKKFLLSYESFYKTLGVTMLNHNMSSTKKNRGRSLIRDKDRATPVNSPRPDKDEDIIEKKEDDKQERIKKKGDDKKRQEVVDISDTGSSDATDQSESLPTTSKDTGRPRRLDKTKENKDNKKSCSTPVQEKAKSVEPIKKEEDDKLLQQTRSKSQTPKIKEVIVVGGSQKKESKIETPLKPVVKPIIKKVEEEKKRGRKKSVPDDKTVSELVPDISSGQIVKVGDKLKVFYGPTHESKVTYEAKVLEIDKDSTGTIYRVHYTGWNTRYDEWINPNRIAENFCDSPKAKRLKQFVGNPPTPTTSKTTPNKNVAKRGRGTSITGRSTTETPARSTTPSSVTSSSSRTKSPVTRSTSRVTRLDYSRRTRRFSAQTDVSNHSDSELEIYESEAELTRTRSGSKSDDVELKTYRRKVPKPSTPSTKQEKLKNEIDNEEDDNKIRHLKKLKKTSEKSEDDGDDEHEDDDEDDNNDDDDDGDGDVDEDEDDDSGSNPPKGRDFDLNQIRSELKGFNKAVKVPSLDTSEKDVLSSSDESSAPIKLENPEDTKELQSSEKSEDIYEFKEPEPFEFETRSKLVEDKTTKKRIPRLYEDLEKSPKKKITLSPDKDTLESDKKRLKRTPKKDDSEDEEKKGEDPFDKLVESPSYNLKPVVIEKIPENKQKVVRNIMEDHVNIFRVLPDSDDYSREIDLSDSESQTQPIFSRDDELFSDPFTKYSPDRTLDLEFSTKIDDFKKETEDMELLRESINRAIERSNTSDEGDNLSDEENELVLTTSISTYQGKKKEPEVSTRSDLPVEEAIVEPKMEIQEEPERIKSPILNISSALLETDASLLQSISAQPLVINKMEETKEGSNIKTVGTKIADSLLQKFSSIKNFTFVANKEEDKKPFENDSECDPKTSDLSKIVKQQVELKIKPSDIDSKKILPASTTTKCDSTTSDLKKRRKIVSKAYIDETDSDSSDSEQLVIARSDEDSQTNSLDKPDDLKESDSNISAAQVATTDDSQSQEEPRNFKFDSMEKTFSPEPVKEDSIECEIVKEEEPDSQLHSLLLCEETIPRSPAPASEAPSVSEQKLKPKSVLEMPFASAPGSSNNKSMLLNNEHKIVNKPQPVIALPLANRENRDAATVIDNTPPTTPESSISNLSLRGDPDELSPNAIENESCKSNDAETDYARKRRNSCKPSLYSEEDSQLTNEANPAKKLREDSVLATCRKRRKSARAEDIPSKRGRKPLNRSRHNSDSDDTSEHSLIGSPSNMGLNIFDRTSKSPRPSKYNFYVEFDPSLDSGQRIAVLQQKLSELRTTYAEVKAELATVERRRKKIRRREREALKASKQELVCG